MVGLLSCAKSSEIIDGLEANRSSEVKGSNTMSDKQFKALQLIQLPDEHFYSLDSATITELKKQAEAHGRDSSTIEISIVSVPPTQDVVQRLESIGVNRVIFDLPSDTEENILPLLVSCSHARI